MCVVCVLCFPCVLCCVCIVDHVCVCCVCVVCHVCMLAVCGVCVVCACCVVRVSPALSSSAVSQPTLRPWPLSVGCVPELAHILWGQDVHPSDPSGSHSARPVRGPWWLRRAPSGPWPGTSISQVHWPPRAPATRPLQGFFCLHNLEFLILF